MDVGVESGSVKVRSFHFLFLLHPLSLTGSLGDPAVSRLDVTSCVPDVTAHLVVGEVRLLNQLRWVHRHLGNTRNTRVKCCDFRFAPFVLSNAHLKDIVSRKHVGDVDPLAVNVGVIRVVAAGTEPLGAFEDTCPSD